MSYQGNPPDGHLSARTGLSLRLKIIPRRREPTLPGRHDEPRSPVLPGRLRRQVRCPRQTAAAEHDRSALAVELAAGDDWPQLLETVAANSRVQLRGRALEASARAAVRQVAASLTPTTSPPSSSSYASVVGSPEQEQETLKRAVQQLLGQVLPTEWDTRRTGAPSELCTTRGAERVSRRPCAPAAATESGTGRGDTRYRR